jgi:N-acetylglucosamine malate deacetylase 1
MALMLMLTSKDTNNKTKKALKETKDSGRSNQLRVLFLGPHTDDVELGSGGTLIRFLRQKSTVKVVVFSTASDSLPKSSPKEVLKEEFLSVANSLKVDNLIFDFKVRYLNFYRQRILEELVKLNNDFKPNIVIGPSLNDYHQDHQTVAIEMVRAFKRDASIICYELPWNHLTFTTQLFVKLTKEEVDLKWQMLQNYKSQILQGREYFTKEFVFGLAKTRGIQCHANYAESFEILRWIIEES